jgi:hypothetical protein
MRVAAQYKACVTHKRGAIAVTAVRTPQSFFHPAPTLGIQGRVRLGVLRSCWCWALGGGEQDVGVTGSITVPFLSATISAVLSLSSLHHGRLSHPSLAVVDKMEDATAAAASLRGLVESSNLTPTAAIGLSLLVLILAVLARPAKGKSPPVLGELIPYFSNTYQFAANTHKFLHRAKQDPIPSRWV